MKRCEARNYQQKHLQQQNVTSQKHSLSLEFIMIATLMLFVSHRYLYKSHCVYMFIHNITTKNETDS